MAVGRYFRGLTAYDLLGNLIPGVLALVAIMGFLHSPPVPDSIGGYALFAVIAFSLGAIIQSHAAIAVGTREHFDKTMEGVEDLPSLTQQLQGEKQESGGDEGETGDTTGSDESTETRAPAYLSAVLHAFFGPVFWWTRPARGEELDDVILANRIWMHLVDTYDIPFTTDSYSVLYHLMSSRVDNISSPSRATRIQAIRNFYRGLWLTSWYSLLLVLLSLGLDACFDSGQRIYPGVLYEQSAFFTYWTPVWNLGVVAAVGIMVFWLLFESTEEDYIEYLFTDYAVAIGAVGTEITFSDDVEFPVSGTLSTTVDAEISSATTEESTADAPNKSENN